MAEIAPAVAQETGLRLLYHRTGDCEQTIEVSDVMLERKFRHMDVMLYHSDQWKRGLRRRC